MEQHRLDLFRKRLERFPKVSLIHTPTPFRKLERLSQKLGGPEIFIKREDMTGLAFGGNKSRKLEYIIPDILAKPAEAVITWAGVQSNWCLQTAAACRVFGVTPWLLLFKTNDLPEEPDGNLLLDHILGAQVQIRDSGSEKFIDQDALDAAIAEVVQQVKAMGKVPYVVPIGGSMPGGDMLVPLGALAYVDAFLEIQMQADHAQQTLDYVIHATGSGSTQAGLAVGAKATGGTTKVLGVSVLEKSEDLRRDMLTIAQQTEQALGLDSEITAEDLIVLDGYIRDGYGIVNRDVALAVRTMAETEGLFLDPVYTGKAFIALLDLVKKAFSSQLIGSSSYIQVALRRCFPTNIILSNTYDSEREPSPKPDFRIEMVFLG